MNHIVSNEDLEAWSEEIMQVARDECFCRRLLKPCQEHQMMELGMELLIERIVSG